MVCERFDPTDKIEIGVSVTEQQVSAALAKGPPPDTENRSVPKLYRILHELGFTTIS